MAKQRNKQSKNVQQTGLRTRSIFISSLRVQVQLVLQVQVQHFHFFKFKFEFCENLSSSF